jgi:hypothetical protein
MVTDKLIRSDTRSARRPQIAGGAILGVMSLIWVLIAVIEWVDLVPGNLAVLNDSRREFSGGDARRGIFFATLGVVAPLAQAALATAVLRGSRHAVTAAVIWLIPLTGLSAWVLSFHPTPTSAFVLIGVLASLALLGWSLLIEQRSKVVVPPG